MKEQLFVVGIRHIKTNEKIELQVWADCVDSATHGLRGLISYDTEYRWTGSGPVYDEHGQIITRDSDR